MPSPSSSDNDSPAATDTGFFAKEGFLKDPKSSEKKSKKHKKHKKDHKHKHKSKDRDKDKNKDVDPGSEKSRDKDTSGSKSPQLPVEKNEKADEFERDLRFKISILKDNLTKKHKALEDINKTPSSPTKKIKLCTEISLVDKYGDKHDAKGSGDVATSSSEHSESAKSEVNTLSNGSGENRSISSSDGKIQVQLSSISCTYCVVGSYRFFLKEVRVIRVIKPFNDNLCFISSIEK